jgi:hypothetical protein
MEALPARGNVMIEETMLDFAGISPMAKYVSKVYGGRLLDIDSSDSNYERIEQFE